MPIAARALQIARTEASGSRGLTRKSRSTTVPQLSQLKPMMFRNSAAAILGQNHE
jgi:hypothetical protein